MFYTFMTGTGYEESDWYGVFCLEVAVHGALRKHFDDYAAMTEDELFDRLAWYVRLGYSRKKLVFTDESEAILRKDLPGIMAFLAANKDNPERKSNAFWRESLRSGVVKGCVSQSSVFVQRLRGGLGISPK